MSWQLSQLGRALISRRERRWFLHSESAAIGWEADVMPPKDVMCLRS